MTDEERFCNKRCSTSPCIHRCEYVSSYLYGLAESRKEKQIIIDSQTVEIESRDVYLAEKENIILRQQNEIAKMKLPK